MTVLDAAPAPVVSSEEQPLPPRTGALTVLCLTEPLPGFPVHRDYVLVPADGSGLVHWLQAVDPDGPRFVVVRAEPFFPDYTPKLSPAVRSELGLDAAEQVAVYCLVTVPGGNVAAATANLRAPLVVNEALGRARQVVLADGGHPIRRPLRR